MHFVIMILASGDIKEYRDVHENSVRQVFNAWRAAFKWAYICYGGDMLGIQFSMRQKAEMELDQ